ncbi:flagellar filament capping protein FliD [Paenibacillus sp. GCM10028914]|uniref:flagellar filament capping protein FliD n=1 Tax=Paenibacillus sp. GCM10028914 TaxID=3273416 RepID=UPI003623116A
MRVSGLSSGMDIDTLVTQLMTAKRAPLDKLNQNKQILEWRRDSYRTINSALVDFRQNKLDKYKKTSEMNVYSAEVSGNKDAISVKATTSANQVSMKVEVGSLATQSTLETASLGEGTTMYTKLGSLNSGAGPFEFSVSRGDGSSSYTQSFKFSKDDTIKDVLTKINGDYSAGLSATFDEAGKKFVVKSKEYGNDTVKFAGSLLTDVFGTTDPEKATQDGQPALVTINGTKYTPSSNQLTVNGVQITLLQETKDAGPATITTKPDGKKALETVKAFISDYNALISTLNSKVSEQKYRSYAPLTSEQKKEMTEDDIKNWESRAKSGLLRNDEILVEGLSNMRTLLSSSSVKFGDKTIGLASIGITTGTYTENGKLYLDEDKLMNAIEENPEQVMELFIGSSDGASKGIFDKMYDNLNVTLSRMADKAGTAKYSTDITISLNEQSTLGKELTDLNDRISTLTKRLTQIENNYYTQFTAMETAINKLNSQSASLSSFTG